MKKFIVTTTINYPTEALYKFLSFKDWTVIVVGDTKTPHEEYRKLPCVYLDPDFQSQKYQNLSDTIGWKSIQRRNIGFVEAYNLGADVIATVDDDNIPYDNWGTDLYVGQTIDCDMYTTERHNVFDPLSVTNNKHVWHRGYPIENVPTRHDAVFKGQTKRKVLVQADLWDGDPDIDAIARLSIKPIVKFDICKPYCSDKIAPFNSQNTFLAREVIPFYFLYPHIGRMDDIWASYVLQYYFPNSVIYNRASVYQERNVQDLVTNLEKEILGYRNTYKLLNNLSAYKDFLPETTLQALQAYKIQVK